jgi:hypothetical protein
MDTGRYANRQRKILLVLRVRRSFGICCVRLSSSLGDITHGGLSLQETPAWVDTKKKIEASGSKVVQWHRDEISPEVSTVLYTHLVTHYK